MSSRHVRSRARGRRHRLQLTRDSGSIMKLGRRAFFRMAAGGCAACLAAARAIGAPENAAVSGHAAGAPAHWSYGGDGGPEHWGDLQPDFKVCQLGVAQTPIDLSGGMVG